MCLVVQIIAYGSQYVLGTVWKQPDFISNIVPAFLATLASSAVTILMRQYCRWKNVDESCKEIVVEAGKCEDEKWNNDIHRDESVDPTEPCRPQVDELQESEEGDSLFSSPTAGLDENGQLPEMSRGAPPRRRRRNTTPSTPRQADSSCLELQNSDTVGFVDTDYDDNNNPSDKNDDLTFTRSYTWFCLMPALYLLVPGAKIFQTAFADLIQGIAKEQHGVDVEDFVALGFSLIVVGFSQVLGLRFGFLTLWLINEANKWIRHRCC